jgi:RHS repeat-associated protein
VYPSFARVGRAEDNRWYSYGQNKDIDRIKYGCDRAGNRIWRENVVAREQYNKPFDEIYSYDGLHRLIDFRRGWLNESRSDLTQMTFRQSWTLDATGNWSEFKEDTDGDGTWDLVQQRSCNPVNEITQITTLTGPTWATPKYDRAGNMTLIPKPADPTQTFTATYDPWNRLVKLVDTATANPIAEYQYDARNRRVVKRTYDDAGNLSEVRHFYFTDQWQDIEKRITYSSTGPDQPPQSVLAERQFVCGRRYIDETLVEDTFDCSGLSDLQRIYSCQDGNWNVMLCTEADGQVVERCYYDAYGAISWISATFEDKEASECKWDRGFAGYLLDFESELYGARNRYLNSALGSWVRRDPNGEYARDSLYGYSGCNPVNCTDPHGLQAARNARQRCCEDAVRRHGGPRLVIRRGGNECIVTIRCADRCPRGLAGATLRPRPTGYRRYTIQICISNRVPRQALDVVITHELAHARVLCRAARGAVGRQLTCRLCRRLERAAFRVSCRLVFNPRTDRARYQRCVSCGVRLACQHIPNCVNVGDCTPADIGLGARANA